jgi:hypothetical protein
MIEAILWDNDGVLVDTERLYFRATKQVLASVGVDLTKEDYIELILVQGRGAWHLAEEKDVPPAAIERLRDERNALYSRYLHEERVLIAGVEETLRALYGKYRMGIFTSSWKDPFDLLHKFTNGTLSQGPRQDGVRQGGMPRCGRLPQRAGIGKGGRDTVHYRSKCNDKGMRFSRGVQGA